MFFQSAIRFHSLISVNGMLPSAYGGMRCARSPAHRQALPPRDASEDVMIAAKKQKETSSNNGACMECFETIQVNMPTYSRSQRTIAQYIIDHPSRALSLSIHDMAAEIGTSASSITRFCRKLGYDSLRDMRVSLAASSDHRAAEDFQEAMSIVGSPERLASDYLQHITDVCGKTLEVNSMETLQEAARLIAQAESVYLFGIGASALAVSNLLGKLVKLKIRCIYSADSDMNVQMADSAGANDVAIAFSYSGFTTDVVKGARNAHDNGCPLITVTHQGDSPLQSISDYALLCPAVEQLTRVTTLFSNYAQAIIVDILFLLVARQLDINPRELLQEYRSIMQSPDAL